jgi:hypothetical protein
MVDRPPREDQQRRRRLGTGRSGRRGGRGPVQTPGAPTPGRSWSSSSEMTCWRRPATSCAEGNDRPGHAVRRSREGDRGAATCESLLSGRQPSRAVRAGRLCHRHRRRVGRPVGGCPAHRAIDASLEGPSCGARLLDAGQAGAGPELALCEAVASGSASVQASRSSRVSTSPVRGAPWRESQASIAAVSPVGGRTPPGMGMTSTAIPGPSGSCSGPALPGVDMR